MRHDSFRTEKVGQNISAPILPVQARFVRLATC